MAYIGRGTDSISNVEVLDNITFNGASSYTLQKGGANFVPVSANNILLSINGVVQANNFSVSGSTIDFGTAVTGTCNFVLHFGTGLITTVQDGAVTTVKIGNDAVTYAKLQNLATANRVLGSTSTGLIGETQIATAMVSDDAITYAKMQDTSAANRVLGAASAGTVGEVQVATDMIADAQVDESKLKISNAPTNGYFLSAQSGGSGGMTWAEAGGGAWTKLNTTTISSAVATIVFNSSLITNTYRDYKVHFSDIEISADANPRMQISSDNGSSYFTANNYKFAMRSYKSDNSTNSSADSGTDSFRLMGDSMQGNDTDMLSSWQVEFFNPLATDNYFTMAVQGMFISGSGLVCGAYGGGMYNANTTSGINNVKFYLSTGNYTEGTVTLYGRKN